MWPTSPLCTGCAAWAWAWASAGQGPSCGCRACIPGCLPPDHPAVPAALPHASQYDAALIGHIIALGVQQCVRELQRQAPQGAVCGACVAQRPLACRHAVPMPPCARCQPTKSPPASLHPRPCPGRAPTHAATITVLGVLPLEPMMLHVPQRIFGAMVDAANAELDGFAAAQANPRLRFRGACAGCTAASAPRRHACHAPVPAPGAACERPPLCRCPSCHRLRPRLQAARRQPELRSNAGWGASVRVPWRRPAAALHQGCHRRLRVTGSAL